MITPSSDDDSELSAISRLIGFEGPGKGLVGDLRKQVTTSRDGRDRGVTLCWVFFAQLRVFRGQTCKVPLCLLGRSLGYVGLV